MPEVPQQPRATQPTSAQKRLEVYLRKEPPQQEGWPINELWAKYEDIAMHFNDLLIKLRTQALGAVAAISALVGLFGKDAPNIKGSWELAAIVFAFLWLFWLAVWLIDFLYYNKLLLGAADALFRLEQASQTQTHIKSIDMSLTIERFVSNRPDSLSVNPRLIALAGRWSFYVIVSVSLAGGFLYSLHSYRNAPVTPAPSRSTPTAHSPATAVGQPARQPSPAPITGQPAAAVQPAASASATGQPAAKPATNPP